MIVDKAKICCNEWEENISQTVERGRKGYAINGCCGGGCFVISEIKYCPFCGKCLKESNSEKINRPSKDY